MAYGKIKLLDRYIGKKIIIPNINKIDEKMKTKVCCFIMVYFKSSFFINSLEPCFLWKIFVSKNV